MDARLPAGCVHQVAVGRPLRGLEHLSGGLADLGSQESDLVVRGQRPRFNVGDDLESSRGCDDLRVLRALQGRVRQHF